ncbi:hypothetical protein E2C01_049630 [Portunus trituberculatus]|uniref:Uncharacterized protein n=1 Tax=Portunus trituberculatus TaxID=210409 RepID=A0A5B7GDP4_PORTR|nr:hypothetical protein [Portunus trituberculatus]
MYTPMPPGYVHSVHSFTRSVRPAIPITILTQAHCLACGVLIRCHSEQEARPLSMERGVSMESLWNKNNLNNV